MQSFTACQLNPRMLESLELFNILAQSFGVFSLRFADRSGHVCFCDYKQIGNEWLTG